MVRNVRLIRGVVTFTENFLSAPKLREAREVPASKQGFGPASIETDSLSWPDSSGWLLTRGNPMNRRWRDQHCGRNFGPLALPERRLTLSFPHLPQIAFRSSHFHVRHLTRLSQPRFPSGPRPADHGFLPSPCGRCAGRFLPLLQGRRYHL